MQKEIILMLNDKEHCDAKCTHCYLPYTGIKSPEEAFEMVALLRDKYSLFVAGSELLVNPDYIKSLAIANQREILSNGLALHKNPLLFNLLKRYNINQIELSQHFGIQKQLNSTPIEITREVVSEGIKRGFTMNLGTVICLENYQDCLEICAQSSGMGVSQIEFIRYVKIGSANSEQRKTMDDSQRANFYALAQLARRTFPRLKIKLNGNFGPLSKKGKLLASQNSYCPAGASSFAVSPDNKIYACNFLTDFPIGRITDRNVFDVRKSIDDYLPQKFKGRRDRCLIDYLL